MRHSLPLALGLTLGLGSLAHADQGTTAWRLFVADHTAPQVHAIDALDGDSLGSFTLEGPAALYASASQAAVFAVQGAAGAVSTIATGIALDDHGDHADLSLSAPKLTGAVIRGERPSHFVEHDGSFAAFFDGEGLARVFTEAAALTGEVAPRTVASGVPHHGAVLPYGTHDLISVPNPEDAGKPPVGLRILDRTGTQVGETVPCVGLHGEAGSGALAVVGGCADGILVVRSGNGAPDIAPLAIPADLPAGRASTLIGGRGLQYFVSNHGPQALLLIDPEEQPAFRRIELPSRRVHFATDPLRPHLTWVITEDGQLHRLDVVAGAITGSLRVTAPYSMDGHWSEPRPRLAIAGDAVYVTEPLAGRIHRVNADTLTQDGSIAVPGVPFNIVAVGGSGASHKH